MNVTFGKGAILNGAAAYTSAVHVSHDGSEALKADGGFAFDNADEV